MSGSGIQRAAVIGTGVIGASWATCFLARGLEVTASDPAPGAEAALREAVAAQWPAMRAMGLAPGASPDRLRFAASPEEAVAEAQFVQENGPERLELKRELFHRLDVAAPAPERHRRAVAVGQRTAPPAAVGGREVELEPQDDARGHVAARVRARRPSRRPAAHGAG